MQIMHRKHIKTEIFDFYSIVYHSIGFVFCFICIQNF